MVTNPLNLKEELKGLENLYDPTGFTQFYIRERVHIHSESKARWLEKMLNIWAAQFDKSTDITVLKKAVIRPSVPIDYAGNYFNPKRIRLCMGELFLEIRVVGGINCLDIGSQDLARSVVDEVKKALALKLLLNFPMSFILEDPKIIAGSVDWFVVENWPSGRETSDIHPTIRKFLTEAGAVYQGFTSSPTDVRYTVVWSKDTSDEERDAVTIKVSDFTESILKRRLNMYFRVW
jgi:hypothetical protein